MENLALVREFWREFSDQKWDMARSLLHPNFVAEWPQSRERMSAEGFINVNRHYPGNHKIEVIHAHSVGEKVITTVWITADTGQKTFANSYFGFEDGKILSIEEYWAEPYKAPEGRLKWVENY